MPRAAQPGVKTTLAITLALCSIGACESAKPPANKSEQAEPAAREGEPSKGEPSKPVDRAAPEPVSEAEVTENTDRPPPPAWFDTAKIQHQALIKQMASEGTIAGGYASAMILELEPGVSNEQCIERAKKALGESLSELPEATIDGDRLMLQGKADDYHYTIVCGEAKGKPTMYLSYTAK
jgi:hypothetical protein